MNTVTIANNEASRTIIGLEPVEVLRGTHHLTISQQSMERGQPPGATKLLELFLEMPDLAAVHAWLGQYLEVNA